jgi:hypothetical protein
MPEKSYAHRATVDKLGLRPGAAVRVVGRGEPGLLADPRWAGRRSALLA